MQTLTAMNNSVVCRKLKDSKLQTTTSFGFELMEECVPEYQIIDGGNSTFSNGDVVLISPSPSPLSQMPDNCMYVAAANTIICKLVG